MAAAADWRTHCGVVDGLHRVRFRRLRLILEDVEGEMG